MYICYMYMYTYEYVGRLVYMVCDAVLTVGLTLVCDIMCIRYTYIYGAADDLFWPLLLLNHPILGYSQFLSSLNNVEILLVASLIINQSIYLSIYLYLYIYHSISPFRLVSWLMLIHTRLCWCLGSRYPPYR